MNSRLLAFVIPLVLLCSMTGLGFAQFASCPGCVLGLYDAEDLATNFGNFTGVQKKIYLGVAYDPASVYDGLAGIELSIQGLPVTAIPPSYEIRYGGVYVGTSIVTPPDTTDPAAQGGWNVVWSSCVPGNVALLNIILVSSDPIPNDTVIRVLRKFPPSNPGFPHVLFNQCNYPFFTMTSMHGGCYVLNPTVGPGESVGNPPCTLATLPPVPTTASTWSEVKGLFR